MKRNNIYTASFRCLPYYWVSVLVHSTLNHSYRLLFLSSGMEEADFGFERCLLISTGFSASTTTWWKVTNNIVILWCYTCQHGYVYRN